MFYFAVIKRTGKPTAELLPDLLRQVLLELPWPKSMRFPAASFRWVRPINSIVSLFDGKVIPLAFDGIPVGHTTRGHRFLAPEPIPVRDFKDYETRLRAAHVILARDERKR